nr:hypothetical protein [Saccharopolyspora sp. HNM0983]
MLTPLIAFGATGAGVLALFFAQRALAPSLVGGEWAICRTPDCLLGVGLWLVAGGFALLCASVIAGALAGFRVRERAASVRRGLIVAACCLVVYLAGSAVFWILV